MERNSGKETTMTGNSSMGPWSRRLLGVLTLVGIAGLGACDLTVEAPDRVLDRDLDIPEAVEAIVAGSVADYAEAYVEPGGGGTINAGAMLTDELVHSGSWIGLRGLSDGESQDDWVESQSRWAEPSQARWTAEQGIPRVTAILQADGQTPSSHRLIAVLNLHAGLANVMLGDNFCQAVIDGGPYQDYTEYYTRAIPYLQEAITVGQAAGNGALSGEWDDGDDVAMAAYGVLARAQMQLGQWSAAVTAAGNVDTDFVYEILYDETAGESNDMRWWGYLRDETTVWGTPFATLGDDLNDDHHVGGDPRVPYDIKYLADGVTWAESGDGRRPFFRQLKYPSYSSDIGGVKGTDARLMEAEDALVNTGGAAAYATVAARINEVRALYGLGNIVTPTTDTEAWQALMTERGIEFWLEGKRLGDWRRWALGSPGVNAAVWDNFLIVRDENTGQPADQDVWQAPILDTEVWAERGDICIQVSKNEKDSNPNIS